MVCTYSKLFFAPVSFLYLCVLLLNFFAKYLLHLLFHLLHLENNYMTSSTLSNRSLSKQLIRWRLPLIIGLTFNLCLKVSSSMTASGFLFGIVGLASSIAAKELNSLHLEGECITILNYMGRHTGYPKIKELTEKILNKLIVVGPNFPIEMTWECLILLLVFSEILFTCLWWINILSEYQEVIDFDKMVPSM